MPTPPVRYPWDNSTVDQRYREWEQRYTQVIAPYSVVNWLNSIGETMYILILRPF
jgi:hypothetical protein